MKQGANQHDACCRNDGAGKRTGPIKERSESEESGETIRTLIGDMHGTKADYALPRLELYDVRDQLPVGQNQGEGTELVRPERSGRNAEVYQADHPGEPFSA